MARLYALSKLPSYDDEGLDLAVRNNDFVTVSFSLQHGFMVKPEMLEKAPPEMLRFLDPLISKGIIRRPLQPVDWVRSLLSGPDGKQQIDEADALSLDAIQYLIANGYDFTYMFTHTKLTGDGLRTVIRANPQLLTLEPKAHRSAWPTCRRCVASLFFFRSVRLGTSIPPFLTCSQASSIPYPAIRQLPMHRRSITNTIKRPLQL